MGEALKVSEYSEGFLLRTRLCTRAFLPGPVFKALRTDKRTMKTEIAWVRPKAGLSPFATLRSYKRPTHPFSRESQWSPFVC